MKAAQDMYDNTYFFQEISDGNPRFLVIVADSR